MAKKSNSKKSGDVRFDMPYVVPDPPLANQALGIDRPALRGKDHTYTIDVTVLDTPDHRLVRSGLLLAHRVSDGLGDWYLNAQEWAPLMPEEISMPVDAEGDLPDRLASLVRPFRRLAPLGPVAAVTLERQAYTIRGTVSDGALVLATLRDDRFTIRKGGVVITRVREVTLRPTPAMSAPQRAHVVSLLSAAGGSRVQQFPPLRERLGAPATGLTDLPAPRPWRDDQSLEEFVERTFATRLRAIVGADLELRNESTESTRHLTRELRGLADEVRGFSAVLEPEWRARFEEHLDALVDGDEAEAPIMQRGDHYMAVLDALVAATRAPRLGDQSRYPASAVMRQIVAGQLTVLRDRCAALQAESASEAWAAALSAARRLRLTALAGAELDGKAARRLVTEVTEVAQALERCVVGPREPDAEALGAMTASAAFEAGRRHQRALDASLTGRGRFVESWPAVGKRLKKAAKP